MHEGAVEEGVPFAQNRDCAASLDFSQEPRRRFFVERIESRRIIGMIGRDFGGHRIHERDLALRVFAYDGIRDGARVAAPSALAEMDEPISRF
jgi:hypothetical protein